MVKRLAGLELNALLYAKVLPYENFNGALIRSPGTPIYDVNGELLYYRIPITKGRNFFAFSDIAANPVFGSPLIAISSGQEWNEKDILNKAVSVAHSKHKGVEFDKTRFVAYSFPKIAIQFLKGFKETLMLEFGTWIPVPKISKGIPIPKASKDDSDVNFLRWSFIESLPDKIKLRKQKAFEKRVSNWEKTVPQKKKFNYLHISDTGFKKVVPKKFFIRNDTREIHYSSRSGDHFTCYELRGQLTNVWCVAASVNMILDFYRYNYDQTRLAQEIGLGTVAMPNGLPYSRIQDVVTVIETLTNNALDSDMNTTPTWTEFRDEIRANRPLISFIPGHSRTVAGYSQQTGGGWYLFRGLLVYDPWPPTTGVITRWENFDTQTYIVTYRAHVTLI